MICCCVCVLEICKQVGGCLAKWSRSPGDGEIVGGRRIKNSRKSNGDDRRHCFSKASNSIEWQMENIIREELKQNLEEAATH